MEALLSSWLAGLETVPVIDEASVSLVRKRVREVGGELACPAEHVESMVLVASELAHNQLAHASFGHVAVVPISRAGVPGIEVIAADAGPGIADPARATLGDVHAGQAVGFGRSLGSGLAAVFNLAGEVDVDVRLRQGTRVRARRFAGEVGRRRQVGIMGRPIALERLSGDAAFFTRADDVLTVGVCDGLGHGPLAAEASQLAIDTCDRGPAGATPSALLTSTHEALKSTRGAVMSIVRIDEATSEFELGAVGNVSVGAWGLKASRRFGASSFVLGSPQRTFRVHTERGTLERREVICLFTDGVTSRVTFADPMVLLQHPIEIAQLVLTTFARDHDDALVLVAS